MDIPGRSLTRDARNARDDLPSSLKSDDSLGRRLWGDRFTQEEIGNYLWLARILRLTDGLLSGHRSAERFVERFSEMWLRAGDLECDRLPGRILDCVEETFAETQMICASDEERRDEALLIDRADLATFVSKLDAELRCFLRGSRSR